MEVLSISYPGQTCAGCNAVEGKIFWTQFMNLDICPIYNCCKNEKQLSHCGLCEELPCELFFSTKDPSFPEEEHLQAIQDRVTMLKSL
jgi:hypothetical protein